MSPTRTFHLAGILGYPVAQSRSPLIHNHWIVEHGLNGRYVFLPVQPEPSQTLKDAIAGMRAMGFAGGNLTMPHKETVIPLLDHIDPAAKAIGAVNTLAFDTHGALTGYNTDGYGFIHSVLDAQPNWRANAGPIVVLGAGGAARSIVYALVQQGALNIRILNRTLDRAQALASSLEGAIEVLPWAQRHEAMSDCATLINTTSLGMYGHEPLDLNLKYLPSTALVADAIYAPLETPLLAAAKAKGSVTVNGLGMLLNQARPAFNAWFGIMPRISPALLKAVHASF